MDPTSGRITKDGQELKLAPRCADVFRILIQADGRTVTREELFRTVWAGDTNVGDGALTFTVHKLRSALKDGGETIETVPGVGYRLGGSTRAPVAAAPERPHAGLIPVLTAFLMGALAIGALVYRGAGGGTPAVQEYRQLTSDHRPKTGPLLVGGGYVWFTEHIGAERQPARVPNGGGATELVNEGWLRMLAISPDGTEILYTRTAGQAGMYAWKWSSDTHRLVTNALTTGIPAWHPSGRVIAVPAGNMILIIDVGSGEVVARAPAKSTVSWLDWNADGTLLRAGMDPTGARTTLRDYRWTGRQLTEADSAVLPAGTPSSGTWFGESNYIYATMAEGRPPLWFQPASVSKPPAPITHGPLYWAYPKATPASKTLYAIGGDSHRELSRFDTRTARWTPTLEQVPATSLEFSRDGERLAYADSATAAVWACGSDGRQCARVSPEGVEAYQPHWSPDRRTISFMGRQGPQQSWRIYLCDPDGRNLRVPVPEGEDQGVPSWSGDGRSIVYGDWRATAAHEQTRVHVLDVRTGTVSTVPGSDGKWTARWSPDGNRIAALSSDSKTLWIYDLAGRRWSKLMTAHYLEDPVWSREGGVVFVWGAFADHAPLDVVRVSVMSGRWEANGVPPEFRTINFAGLDRDGAPVLLHSAGSEEVYALEVGGR